MHKVSMRNPFGAFLIALVSTLATGATVARIAHGPATTQIEQTPIEARILELPDTAQISQLSANARIAHGPDHARTTTTLSEYAYASAPRALPVQTAATNAGNYLAEITSQGKMTWQLAQMPLRVFIEDGAGTPGYEITYPNLIRRAFNEWQQISNSQLRWVEVNSPRNADIVCSWTAVARPKGSGVEAGETKTTIRKNLWTGGGQIVSANVVVLTDLFGHQFSDTDIYKTCLHEVGHALGLQGHSSTVGDIMYPVLNPRQTPYLKERDRNTIMALYSSNDDSQSVASRMYGQQRANGWFDPAPGYIARSNYQNPWATNIMPPGNRFSRGWIFIPMPVR